MMIGHYVNFRSAAIMATLLAAPVLPMAEGTTPPVALEPLDCVVVYGMVEWSGPEHLEAAIERARHVLEAHGFDVSREALREEVYWRMQDRGTPLTQASTDEEVIEATDSLMADIHACDARYGFPPLPRLWFE